MFINYQNLAFEKILVFSVTITAHQNFGAHCCAQAQSLRNTEEYDVSKPYVNLMMWRFVYVSDRN